jgi:short-subunit dehydrogenase
MSGYFGNPGFSLYSASKAFTRYLSEGLWHEFKQYGVDLLCPVVGPTDTPTMRRAYGELQGAMAADEVAVSALDALGFGPIWIGADIAPQVAAMEAMAPAERSALSAKWAEDFVLHGKKPEVAHEQ